jgi:hypothetical protein
MPDEKGSAVVAYPGAAGELPGRIASRQVAFARIPFVRARSAPGFDAVTRNVNSN